MKKSIKLSIVFAIAVILCMLFAVFASAEAYTAKYSYVGGTAKSETTADDGTITLPSERYSTTEGKTFFGWYTEDGTFYDAGETVVLTEDTTFTEATVYEINSADDLVYASRNYGGHLVRLNCDIELTSKLDFNWWTTYYIDLNGHTLSIDVSGKKTAAMSIQRGSVRFFNSAEEQGKVLATVDEGYGLINLNPHGYGDGKNNRLVVGKNVYAETNGALVYVTSSMTGAQTITNPRIDVYGTTKSTVLVRQAKNTLVYSEAAINIYDGAKIELTADTWWENYNSTAGSKQAILTVGDATLIVANPEAFNWNVDISAFGFYITGGKYNVQVPSEILKYGLQNVYNDELGLYEVKLVGCPLDEDGNHNYLQAEEYADGYAVTCTNDGLHYFRCECGSYYIDTVSALGHDYSLLLSETAATCTAKAYKSYRCIRCDSTTNVEYGNALGHSYTISTVEKLATVYENGVKRVTCDRCENSYTYEYSFDPSEQIITITVKTEDATKEITAAVKDIYEISISETTSSFSCTFKGVKTITDPDNEEITYTIADVVELVIPAGFTNIGGGSIKNATALEKITLLDGANVTFASGAINNCAALTTISIGNATVTFKSNVISGTTSITTLDFEKANVKTESNAFTGKSTLKNITFGSGKTYVLGGESFKGASFEELIFPDGCDAQLAYACFYQNYSLKYIYVGKGITELDNAFDQCTGLQKVVLMDVTWLGNYSFCLANKGEDVLRIYHHADSLSIQGNFCYQSHGAILYTSATTFTGSMANCSATTKTVNGVNVSYPAYTIVKGIPHEYTEGSIEATCTAMGSTGYTTDCPCGVVEDATYVTYKAVNAGTAVNGNTAIEGSIVVGATTAALGHEFTYEESTIVGTTAATCVKNATIIYKCTRCDETETVEQENTATNHKTDGVEWTVTKEATCTQDGLQIKLCTVCKALAESEIIEAKGHDTTSQNWVEVTKATCTTGSYSELACDECEAVVERKTGEPNGHDIENVEWSVAIASTCVSSGVEQKICSECEAIVETRTTEALGHEFDTENGAKYVSMVYENGITEMGVLVTKCARCNNMQTLETGALFEAKGYSVNNSSMGISGGYTINLEALKAYEEINGKLSFGMVIVNANSFEDGVSFLDENGKLGSKKGIQLPLTSRTYSNFDCSITGFSSDMAASLELIITAYAIDADGNVTYIQSESSYALEASVNGVSFDKVTLDLVKSNIPSSDNLGDVIVPDNDEE